MTWTRLFYVIPHADLDKCDCLASRATAVIWRQAGDQLHTAHVDQLRRCSSSDTDESGDSRPRDALSCGEDEMMLSGRNKFLRGTHDRVCGMSRGSAKSWKHLGRTVQTCNEPHSTKTLHDHKSNDHPRQRHEKISSVHYLVFDTVDATRVKLVVESIQDSMTRRCAAMPITLCPN